MDSVPQLLFYRHILQMQYVIKYCHYLIMINYLLKVFKTIFFYINQVSRHANLCSQRHSSREYLYQVKSQQMSKQEEIHIFFLLYFFGWGLAGAMHSSKHARKFICKCKRKENIKFIVRTGASARTLRAHCGENLLPGHEPHSNFQFELQIYHQEVCCLLEYLFNNQKYDWS